MNTFEALIQHTPGRSTPDVYDPLSGRPAEDFVVCRDIDGNVVSCYGDLIWDRSAYSVTTTTKLHFKFWKGDTKTANQQAILDDLHWIMFMLIWRNPTGRALATKTLNTSLIHLRILARHADSAGIDLKLAFSNSKLMPTVSVSGSMAISAVVSMLIYLGHETTGFTVDSKILEPLREAAYAYQDTLRQTAPIPTRIYSHILGMLDEQCSRVHVVMDNLVSAYNAFKRGDGRGQQEFDALIEKFGLIEFWGHQEAVKNVQGFSRVLREIQSMLSVHIQAYTGMRAEEARYLPFDCLELAKREGDGRVHYIVKGTVTKLTSGKEVQTQWITIEAAATTISAAQKLARAVYVGEGIQPNRKNSRRHGALLFPRLNCDGKSRPNHVFAKPNNLTMTAGMLAVLCPVITTEDQKELDVIDPNRDWASEDAFKVGTSWRLQTHQLRRSLALYAQSSGLVSLPSLKRQLQHITFEMSLYYAKGSAFSKNFIGRQLPSDEKHFGEEWQETQPISQYFSYISGVVLAGSSEMFGGHVHWLNFRKRDENGSILIDRAETLKRFQRGEMAYRETPLGGCVNPAACDKTPINILSVECLESNCKNLVASTKKIERIIVAKTNAIKRLKVIDSTSAELRIEQAELGVLQNSLSRAKQQFEEKA